MAAAVLLCAFLYRRIPGNERSRLPPLTILIVVGVFLNAAITGGLADIGLRYEARVIWLVVFLAMLYVAAALRSDWSARSASASLR